MIIEQSGCITYKLTNLTIGAGQILNLADIVLISGDFNSDNEIEVMDLTIINDKFFETVSQDNSKYDLNKDGKIDENDRNIIKGNYGKKFNEQVASYTIVLIDDVAVAQVGTKKYLKLETAISAVPATNVQTAVTMLKNTTESVTITSNKYVLLYTNGKTISSSGAAITNNGILAVQGSGSISGASGITNTGTLYEGVRINGSSDGYRYSFGTAESYYQTFTNTPVITGGTYGITATNSINFNDGTIRGVSGAFNLSGKTIYLPTHSSSPIYEYGIKYTSVNGYQTATITTY